MKRAIAILMLMIPATFASNNVKLDMTNAQVTTSVEQTAMLIEAVPQDAL